MKRLLLASLLAVGSLGFQTTNAEPALACEPEPITANTPSGIAGCEQWGAGKASMYSQTGWGVAMNFCTWERRHSEGCGLVQIVALDTGLSIVAPVVDFCDCYWTTDRRLVDLQGDVVRALGLDPARGIWPVEVWPTTGVSIAEPISREDQSSSTLADQPATPEPMMPDTSMLGRSETEESK